MALEVGRLELQIERWDLVPILTLWLREWVVRRRVFFTIKICVLEQHIWNRISCSRGNLFLSKTYPTHHYLSTFLSKGCTQLPISTCIAVTAQELIPILNFLVTFVVFIIFFDKTSFRYVTLGVTPLIYNVFVH